MPIVRGRFVPEIESAGKVKRCFDVLLWGDHWSKRNLSDLDQIEGLREYLRSLMPRFSGIRLFVPSLHAETIDITKALNSRVKSVDVTEPDKVTSARFQNEELATAVQTAIACDADALVVTNERWFPYIEDAEKVGVFLADTGVLKQRCEIFSRGHDVPWSGSLSIWNLTWTAFYQMAESETFRSGTDFLSAAAKKKADNDGQETGRSLVHNRLPNICFTRDRLLFYEIQRLASVRHRWERQSFSFETAYYLNFYYPVIFGGFDQLALIVNQILKLGVPEKKVGATYAGFLDTLRARSSELHAIFTDTKQTEFIKRIGALRHFASHRGSLMPTQLIQKPENEPTDAELDAEISGAGIDEMLEILPEGELRESFRANIRHKFKMAHYEKSGNVVDGVVPIVIDGEFGFIRPAADTVWNFQRFLTFMNQVFIALGKHL